MFMGEPLGSRGPQNGIKAIAFLDKLISIKIISRNICQVPLNPQCTNLVIGCL